MKSPNEPLILHMPALAQQSIGEMFFHGWEPLLRIPIVTLCAYFGLVVILRVSGKRTLSALNTFDMVVTIAMGSTLATVILNRDTAVLEGILAFLMLVLIQFAVTWLSVRSRFVSTLVKSEPRMLYYHGEFLTQAMRKERVTHDEVLAVIREAHLGTLDQVEAVVLETEARLSVIRRSPSHQPRTILSERGAAQDTVHPAVVDR
jgi:uncharacterized membrane protein YcaP (DUF421 family)